MDTMTRSVTISPPIIVMDDFAAARVIYDTVVRPVMIGLIRARVAMDLSQRRGEQLRPIIITIILA